ncbi:hypothetical protein CSKR_203596 [Clonorchis sinensis]|uniref:Uncharacterized protein n=1 Tax=Clonorchis sinensis TaxID=79923 RepID=A0A8T1MDG4_CLOSI|nr:hypothetical protein CSKR_203596 [Clonorchis sinensis]
MMHHPTIQLSKTLDGANPGTFSGPHYPYPLVLYPNAASKPTSQPCYVGRIRFSELLHKRGASIARTNAGSNSPTDPIDTPVSQPRMFYQPGIDSRHSP